MQLFQRHSIYSPEIKIVSIYGNETSKIYPELNSLAPQEPQVDRLRKLTEI